MQRMAIDHGGGNRRPPKRAYTIMISRRCRFFHRFGASKRVSAIRTCLNVRIRIERERNVHNESNQRPVEGCWRAASRERCVCLMNANHRASSSYAYMDKRPTDAHPQVSKIVIAYIYDYTENSRLSCAVLLNWSPFPLSFLFSS